MLTREQCEIGANASSVYYDANKLSWWKYSEYDEYGPSALYKVVSEENSEKDALIYELTDLLRLQQRFNMLNGTIATRQNQSATLVDENHYKLGFKLLIWTGILFLFVKMFESDSNYHMLFTVAMLICFALAILSFVNGWKKHNNAKKAAISSNQYIASTLSPLLKVVENDFASHPLFNKLWANMRNGEAIAFIINCIDTDQSKTLGEAITMCQNVIMHDEQMQFQQEHSQMLDQINNTASYNATLNTINTIHNIFGKKN
ncbi:hypothetical protein [Xylocopilactobacillus apis]|uniref:Uncharacterized protein n=1 Tax=Xylocopilactobacillus apis TaxID=2932183 RepID=A0AAU9CRM5_9LACO|nr:hypothetical protein [Xylocopilactobacillus apis]BDR56587.1 hypothetical protein KIMC2_11490 [Xylocopilactobacillus apis]